MCRCTFGASAGRENSGASYVYLGEVLKILINSFYPVIIYEFSRLRDRYCFHLTDVYSESKKLKKSIQNHAGRMH